MFLIYLGLALWLQPVKPLPLPAGSSLAQANASVSPVPVPIHVDFLASGPLQLILGAGRPRLTKRFVTMDRARPNRTQALGDNDAGTEDWQRYVSQASNVSFVANPEDRLLAMGPTSSTSGRQRRSRAVHIKNTTRSAVALTPVANASKAGHTGYPTNHAESSKIT